MWKWLWVFGVACGPVPVVDGPVDTGTAPVPPAGMDLFAQLAGLWTGPVTNTPVGNLPIMNVDFRAADAATLWGRVDWDPDNALRFALAFEDHGDGPVLVYRNGGFFLGLLRDDRTVLTEVNEAGDTFTFCHLTQGCDYVEAVYTFDGPDALSFDVAVYGRTHVDWSARRAQPGSLPEGFPSEVLADGAPLPTLPELQLTVRWSTPLEEAAQVWVVLSTTPCSNLTCVPSRASVVEALPGATEATARLPEIHSGDYLVTAVLDRDRDFAVVPFPEAGDGVSLPDRPVAVQPTGTTTQTVQIFLGG